MKGNRTRLLERTQMAFRMGDLVAAERLCAQILARTPDDAEALNLLGVVAFSRKDFVEAERCFSAAWGASPENLGSLFNLGKVFESERRLEDAAVAYRKILVKHANHAESRLRLGIVRYQQSAYEEAINAFQNVLELEPNNTTAALNLGLTYNADGQYEESVRVLRKLVARDPAQIQAYHALADSLIELRRPEEAVRAARVALAREEDDVQALITLGQAQFEIGDYAAAERSFRHAAAFAPDRHEPWMNIGVIDQRFGRVRQALQNGRRAVDLAPTDPLAHFNYSMALFAAADFTGSWKEAEWRMQDPKMRNHFPYRNQLPLWAGERLPGKLLVAREQDLSDFILFSRFFAEARERTAQLVVETPPELLPLYCDVDGIELVCDRCDPRDIQAFSAYVPIASLPFVLGIDENTIAARVPYLSISPASVTGGAGTAKIGLVLSGSRAYPAEAFASLAETPELECVPLQRADLGELAAACADLDLVITADVTAAHLAGALGKPIWLLHDFSASLLWQPGRLHSPWYPAMRVFRPSQPGDWAGVIDEVRSELRAIQRTPA
jgi:tetratricopeptide (TPR) repeat protein